MTKYVLLVPVPCFGKSKLGRNAWKSRDGKGNVVFLLKFWMYLEGNMWSGLDLYAMGFRPKKSD